MRHIGVWAFLTAMSIAGATPTANAQQTQRFQANDAAELERLTATTIDLANQLRSTSSPLSVRTTSMLTDLKANPAPVSMFMLWHEISLSVTALDHAPQPNASPSSFHEQYGPARTSRALAIVHLAMFEAANTLRKNSQGQLSPRYESYTKTTYSFDQNSSQSAAIVEAAYDTLSELYPGLREQTLAQLPANDQKICPPNAANGAAPFSLRSLYQCSLSILGSGTGISSGLMLGKQIAASILAARRNDGATEPEPSWGIDFSPVHVPNPDGTYPVSQWQIDPVSGLHVVLGGRWSDVAPFALSSANEFRLLDSDAPITALRTKAVKDWPSYKTLTTFAGETRLNSLGDGPIGGKTVGGDPYFIAKFWAYDATAGLCAPARLYNQIADAVLSVSKQSPWLQDTADIARYYALVNLAMADAAIAAWDSKFYFQFARPVSAIRVQQASELAPGDPKRNESWYPLGAQNTNASVTYNVTPSKLSE